MGKKPRIAARTALEDPAALVCTTLEAHGISVVLCAGAVVAIYSGAEYVSYDLDIITIGLSRKVDTAMQSLGFEKILRHWTHPTTRYWVEFLPGPVAIGEGTIRAFAEHETRMGTLRLLVPTECVMDRLAWCFHEADTQWIEQWPRGERPHGEERFRECARRLRDHTGT